MNGYMKASLGLGLAITMVAGNAQTISLRPDTGGMLERRMPTAQPEAAYVPGRVLVKFKSEANQAAGFGARAAVRAQAIASIRATQVRQLRVDGDVAVLAVDDVDAALAALNANPAVQHASPDYIVSIEGASNDPYGGSLWGLSNTGQTINGQPGTPGADIHATAAWKTTMGSPDVIVAVIDTGIATTHPDLATNIWTNSGEIPGNGVDDDANGFIDDLRGWNFVSNNASPEDDHGHGTHVSGTIAAIGNNNIGVIGVAPGTRILPLKILNSAGKGTTSDMLEAMSYAAQMGARIVNCSFGGTKRDLAAEQAIAALAAKDILVVAAAGNEGFNNDYVPLYPASYQLNNIISVAASDNQDDATWFSNYGGHSVHIAAPGDEILSTYPPDGYAFMSGTSMATPHIAGIAALALSRFPAMKVDDLRAQIVSNVRFSPAWTDFLIAPGIADAAASLRGCTADFDGSGFINFDDFDAFVTSFESGQPAADTNQDGFLDFTDFDFFVAAFEQGCAAPAAPAAFTASLDDLDFATVRWTAPVAPNAHSLLVESTTDGQNFRIEGVLPTNATSLDEITPPEMTTTTFRITTRSDAGTSAPAGCTLTHTLNRPFFDYVAFDTTDNWNTFFAELVWYDFSSKEDSYRLAVSTDAGAHWTNFGVYAANADTAPLSGLAPDTTYQFKLRAANGTTYSAYSPVGQLSTPPKAPGTLSACNVWATALDLCWSDTNRTETAYRIAMSTDGGANFNNIGETGPNASSFRVTGLSPKTAYIFKVRAMNDAGFSPYTNTVIATTSDVAANGAPSNVRIDNLWPDAVDIRWNDNATNEDGFRVFISTDNASWSEVFPRPAANDTAKRITGLLQNTRYFVKVLAYNSFGPSDYSQTLTFDTPSGLPAAPTSLRAANLWPNTIDLAWNDNSPNEDGFRVFISTDAVTWIEQFPRPGTNATGIRVSGLSPSTHYYVKVRAYNAFGGSPDSPIFEFNTPSGLPATPTALLTVNVWTTQADIRWTDNASDETAYRVSISTDGVNFSNSGGDLAPNSTSHRLSNLIANKRYWVRVRCSNSFGYSDYSNVISFTTKK